MVDGSCIVQVTRPLAGELPIKDMCMKGIEWARPIFKALVNPPGHLVKCQDSACLRCRVAAVHCRQQLIPQPEQRAAERATQLSQLPKQLQQG